MPKGNIGKPKKDITGHRFGSRVVLSYVGHSQKWVCKCDCGHIGETEGYKLKKGESTMCPQCAINKKIKDRNEFMVGKVFGRLTVVERVSSINHDRWLCVCECGAKRNIYGYSLLQGQSKSCPKCSSVKEGTSLRRLFATYKDHAIKRGYDWSLSLEEFKKITQSNCFYTGLPPASIAKCKGASIPYIYNGVDRLDNTKGYTIENSVPCKGRVNEMKMEATYDDFIDMCYMIIKEHERKKQEVGANKLKAV